MKNNSQSQLSHTVPAHAAAIGQSVAIIDRSCLANAPLHGSMRRFSIALPLEGIHAGNRKLHRARAHA